MPSPGPIPGNLPRQLTSFIGRAHELRDLHELLKRSRLLTLTGPGGSGKTRLSLELAAESVSRFPDGVFYVALAPVGQPDLVLSSIAQATGLHDAGDRPLLERLCRHLGTVRALLLLDNFEHVIAAAPAVAEILRATAGLTIMVTSRSPLHVTGEQEFTVPPMQVPDQPSATVAAVAECESVRLFVERAQAVWPSLVLNEENADSIAKICQRLDGLPLAVELAAARIKLLPPASLLARLENALPVLVGGARDLPQRQQTLNSTMAWSYDLLGAGAKRLLAACSVFRGGIALATAETICAGLGIEVLAGLEELVDQSLLRRIDEPGDPRFGMLEQVREYAYEQLAEMPERTRVESGHAATFLALAEAAERGLRGPDELQWLDLLEAEHQNIRAAIDWYTRHEPVDALRLAVAMFQFWRIRGHFTEGRSTLSTLLDANPGATAARIGALNGTAWLAIDQGDDEYARDLLSESIQLSQELGDRPGEAMALVFFGRSLITSARPAEAGPYIDRALRLLEGKEGQVSHATALLYAGLAAHYTGENEQACVRFDRCIEEFRAAGFRSMVARALQMLAHARLELKDIRGAREALEEALPTCLELGDRWLVPLMMAGFAEVAACTGRPQRALRLAGVAIGVCEAGQFSMPTVALGRLERWLAPARKLAGPVTTQIMAEGQQMGLAEAVRYAMANEPEDAWRGGPHGTLTRRELEVATLVAQGLTNRDIAGRLGVSVRTIDTHVDHVLTKLGFNSRTQLVAWSFECALAPGNT
jgi:predicted ATPase/DNA-binding CsgD family transcriptional regulator